MADALARVDRGETVSAGELVSLLDANARSTGLEQVERINELTRVPSELRGA